MKHFFDKYNTWILSGILILAFSLRLTRLLTFPRKSRDGITFIKMARDMRKEKMTVNNSWKFFRNGFCETGDISAGFKSKYAIRINNICIYNTAYWTSSNIAADTDELCLSFDYRCSKTDNGNGPAAGLLLTMLLESGKVLDKYFIIPASNKDNRWHRFDGSFKLDKNRKIKSVSPSFVLKNSKADISFDNLNIKDSGGEKIYYENFERVTNQAFANKTVPFGYPELLKMYSQAGFDIVAANAVTGMILGSLLCLIVYFMGKRICSANCGLLAALLTAVQPYLVRSSVDIIRESVYIPLITLCIFAGISAITTKKAWWWVLFGALAALAPFIRREGYELLLFFICWTIWIGIKHLYHKQYNELKLLAGTFTIVILTWIVVFACGNYYSLKTYRQCVPTPFKMLYSYYHTIIQAVHK